MAFLENDAGRVVFRVSGRGRELSFSAKCL